MNQLDLEKKASEFRRTLSPQHATRNSNLAIIAIAAIIAAIKLTFTDLTWQVFLSRGSLVKFAFISFNQRVLAAIKPSFTSIFLVIM